MRGGVIVLVVGAASLAWMGDLSGIPDVGVASRFAFSVLFPDRRGELDGPQVCRICGGPCREGIPHGQVVSDSWTMEGLVRRPDSDVDCPACAWAQRATSARAAGTAAKRGEPVPHALHIYFAFAISRGGLAGFGSADRPRLLLRPPDPPVVIVVFRSDKDRKRNALLHAVVSADPEWVRALVGHHVVMYRPKRLLDLVGGGVPPSEWPWPYSELSKFFPNEKETKRLLDEVVYNGS